MAAFAQLIASRKTVAPLSIGIFGEWGSGKTFFMERLHDAIDGITSKEAKVDPATFHSSIVQIRFNAWHYIETNLWASLVEFIFRELDGWLRSRQTQEDIEALFEQLATSKQLRLEAARDLIEQRSAKQAAEKLLQTARQDHETAILKRAEAPAADVWAAAKDLFFKSLGAEERRQLEQAAEDLGLSALQKSEAGLAQLLKDSRTQAERTRLVARSLLGRLGTPIWVCAAVLIVLLVPFAAGALKTMLNSAGDKSWLRNVSSSAFGLASLLSTVAVAGRILLGRASKALDSLDQFQEELAKSVSDATRSQQECVTRSEKELADAKLALAEAQRRFAAASDRAIAAEQEYQNDTARGRLNRFIRAKVANGEYAKHLSLVATIRRDFSQLAQIMRDEKLEKSDEEDLAKSRSLYQKKLEELIKEYPDAMTPQEIEDLRREPEQSQLRFFKRIILYIDDLDRCSPEKVADVLQAIHMLLFFPLFVVVVAVDARWVTRSLEIKFPHLLYPEDQEVGATAIADNADSRLAGRPNWVSTGIGRVPPATALDYIEKIFHIPFWVRSMDKDTSADFVAGLAKGFSTADSQPQPDVLLTPGETRPRRPEMIDSEKAKRQELDHSDPAPVIDDQTSQAGVPSVLEKGAAAQRSKIFKTTPLSNDEIAMLRRFAPYIGDTPRSAKRFVNLYHLLRTSLGRTGDIRGADDLVHWLALIGLLSLVTGAPEFAGQFLATLDNEELLGNVHDGVFSRLGTSLAAEPEGQRAALEGILRCLTEESAKGKITDGQMIEVLRRFGSTITRYSFYGHQSKGANKRRSWPTRSFAKGA